MFAMGAGFELFASGMRVWQTGLRFGEMLIAANSVIGTRVGLIQAATRNPFAADHAELGRMVPEKVEAFSKAGRIAFEETMAVHRATGEQLVEIGAMLLDHRPSLPKLSAAVERIQTRQVRAVTRAMESGGAVMAPVHSRATSNARRLKRSK